MYHEYSMERILNDLHAPGRVKNLILDTDTYNEIDDQFAIAYAMLADDINLLAITAAPFVNSRAGTPEEGMEKSYEEMLRVRALVDPDNRAQIPCYRGSCDYMKNMITPQPSEAAGNIVRLVREAGDTVYIAMLGCYTNVASALLMDPSIMDKAVIVMIGANAFERGDCNEFNLMQDRNAARVIFESGVPVVVLPAIGGTEHITTTNAELSYYLRGKAGRIGDYLCDIFEQEEGEPVSGSGACSVRTRIIWDIGSIAFLRDWEGLCGARIVPARTIDCRGFWQELNADRSMIYADKFRSDAIFSDLYTLIRAKCADR